MKQRPGFTLVELLTVIAIVGILSSILIVAVSEVRFKAQTAESTSNIRQLVTASQLYASEHGRYAPWGNDADTIQWHGRRVAGEFTGRDGYLSPYLEGGEVKFCPILDELLEDGKGFDIGAGGYGYNGIYIGAEPGTSHDKGNLPSRVTRPAETIMFTSTAIAAGDGVVETALSAPPRTIVNGGLGGSMTPTTHFRFRGEALVAWADGHITLEPPSEEISTAHNVYGDDNDSYAIGWIGPAEWNGYWNPRFREEVPY